MSENSSRFFRFHNCSNEKLRMERVEKRCTSFKKHAFHKMQFTFDFLYLLTLFPRTLESLARKSSEDKVPPETIFFCVRSRRLITFLHIQLLCNEQRLNFYYFSLRMLSTKKEAFIAKVSFCFIRI